MSDRIHTVTMAAAILRLMDAVGEREMASRHEYAATAHDLYEAVRDEDVRRHPTSKPLPPCTCGKSPDGSYHPSRPCERHPTDDGA